MDVKSLKDIWDAGGEESRILSGLPFDPSIYFEDKTLIKSEKLLGHGRYEIGIKTHPRYAAFPEHGHNFVEMMMVASGTITHRIGERRLTLSEGDVLLMSKHVRHSIERAGENDLGINVIMTDSFFSSLSTELSEAVFSGFLKENASSDGSGAYLHFSTRGDRQAENLIENIALELKDPKKNSVILSRTLALLLSTLGLRTNLLCEASAPEDTDKARRAFIAAYVKNNYRTAELSELGGQLFLSVPYLSMLVRSYFGCTFGKLVLKERLFRADRLITTTKMPILEVIRSVGYENASYFHREYKKAFGTTPLARRNSCKL